MTKEEKAKGLGQKYFPDENNIWARANFEAQNCTSACLEMAEWKDEQFKEEKKELLGLVEMLPVNETNQTIIEDLKGLLK